jgi:hypothetical protein
MNKIDSDTHTAIVGPRHEEIEQHGANQRLSVHDIVVNLLTCEPARTSILFRWSERRFFFPLRFCAGRPIEVRLQRLFKRRFKFLGRCPRLPMK